MAFLCGRINSDRITFRRGFFHLQLVGVGPDNQRFEAEKKKGINVKFILCG
jgi:hypothetical protein